MERLEFVEGLVERTFEAGFVALQYGVCVGAAEVAGDGCAEGGLLRLSWVEQELG